MMQQFGGSWLTSTSCCSPQSPAASCPTSSIPSTIPVNWPVTCRDGETSVCCVHRGTNSGCAMKKIPFLYFRPTEDNSQLSNEWQDEVICYLTVYEGCEGTKANRELKNKTITVISFVIEMCDIYKSYKSLHTWHKDVTASRAHFSILAATCGWVTRSSSMFVQ